MVDIDREEFGRGLRETRRYLLSHHPPADYHKCYRVAPFGRTVRLCSRCVGIYPGIVLGLLGYLLVPPSTPTFLGVAVLPAPALVDWTVTTYTGRSGHNVVRTLTGLLLGIGYGLGLGMVVGGLDGRVIVVGVVYGVVAGVLLARRPPG